MIGGRRTKQESVITQPNQFGRYIKYNSIIQLLLFQSYKSYQTDRQTDRQTETQTLTVGLTGGGAIVGAEARLHLAPSDLQLVGVRQLGAAHVAHPLLLARPALRHVDGHPGRPGRVPLHLRTRLQVTGLVLLQSTDTNGDVFKSSLGHKHKQSVWKESACSLGSVCVCLVPVHSLGSCCRSHRCGPWSGLLLRTQRCTWSRTPRGTRRWAVDTPRPRYRTCTQDGPFSQMESDG